MVRVTWPASRVAHSPHRGPRRGSTAASSVPSTGSTALYYDTLVSSLQELTFFDIHVGLDHMANLYKGNFKYLIIPRDI